MYRDAMSLPVVLGMVTWVVAYLGGCAWLWRTHRWTPRRHLILFAATSPLLIAGPVAHAWGSKEVVTYAFLYFAVNFGFLIGAIWLGIRRREREDAARDTELRWNMKS